MWVGGWAGLCEGWLGPARSWQASPSLKKCERFEVIPNTYGKKDCTFAWFHCHRPQACICFPNVNIRIPALLFRSTLPHPPGWCNFITQI